MKSGFPVSAFVSDLVSANGLDDMGFARFIMFPGMLWGSMEKWWGDGGLRPSSHEGMDLCFFDTHDGRRYRLDESVSIPIAFDGMVVRIMDDLLGRTVVVQSRGNPSYAPFYTFYAHIRPDRNLRQGDRLSAGSVFATIAQISSSRILLPAHLHVTMAGADGLPPVETLTWPIMNRLDRSVFLNPLGLLESRYKVEKYAPSAGFFDVFESIKHIRNTARGKNET